MTLRTLLLLLLSIPATAQSRFQDPQTQKWGYQDADWNIIVPAVYDEVQPNMDTIMAVKKDGKMGAVDQYGNFRIPLVYEYIMPNLNPFRTQFGYAAVTKNSKVSNSWGMVDARGKVILPEKFQYVRAITPNLLVGRVDGDSMLQFFNLRGEPQFQIKGGSVEPGRVDNSFFEVNPIHGGGSCHAKLDGSWVHPADPRAGIWTDGSRTILWRENKMGMIDDRGKIIIPFAFNEITPGLSGQFVALNRAGSNLDNQSGVFDKTGKVVIPVANQEIYALEGVYRFTDIAADKNGIYGADGRVILPAKYHFSGIFISDDYQRIPEMHPEWYVYVQDPAEPNSSFLVRKDGTIIRPEGSFSVRYYSELHPLILQMRTDSVGQLPRYKAVDFSGKELLPAEYYSLDFTSNPNLLTGRKALKGAIGFIPLDAPHTAEFTFEYLQKMQNHYLVGRKQQDFALFSPAGKRIHEGAYSSFSEPNKAHFEQFRSRKGTSGRLVAVGFRAGMAYGDWVGINDSGLEFLFKKPELVAVKPTKPAPVAKEAVEELVLEAPVAASQPSGDDYFTYVEEMPQYPGGEAELLKFLKDKQIYPQLAKENGIQGMVVLSFIVEKDGSLSNFQVLRDIGGGCGQEALRMVRAMPKWIPGKQKGQVIRVKYTLRVSFRLE
ncbi:MAG: TonB family protein [Chitinophagales bacterium]|nr:TonB family protein [Chitinophagales bacterium]